MYGDGPLLVLAGAGSGKTRVLTLRIAQLVQDRGLDPRHILAVTFTNKAAGEMRERLARQIGGQLSGMWVGTFHSVGARLLRAAAPLVGRTSHFTIYDQDDTASVVKRLMEARGITPREWTPTAIANAISSAMNALVSAADYGRLANDPLSRAAAGVYADLEGVLRAQNAVTFDDLLALPVRIFREHPDQLAAYQSSIPAHPGRRVPGHQPCPV